MEFEFSDEQIEHIKMFSRAFDNDHVDFMPVRHKKTGNIVPCMIIINDDETDILPLGILFTKGTDTVDDYEFPEEDTYNRTNPTNGLDLVYSDDEYGKNEESKDEEEPVKLGWFAGLRGWWAK